MTPFDKRLYWAGLVMFVALWISVAVACTSAWGSAATRAALEAKATQFWAHQGHKLPPLTAVGHYRNSSDEAARAEQPGTNVYLHMPVWRSLSWPMKCTVWIHERGHNIGFGHSTIGVMVPVLMQPTKTCRRFGR